MARSKNASRAATAITDLLRIVEIVPVEKADFHQALVLDTRNFEDAVQAACAMKIGADALVTRNEKDFRNLSITVASPIAVLAILQTEGTRPKS